MILSNYGMDANNFPRDLAVLAAFSVGFYLLAFVLLYYRMHRQLNPAFSLRQEHRHDNQGAAGGEER